jgi:hypothetical protein
LATIDPTKHDIEMYQVYVNAAMDCHIALGCTVTHKCYLMWSHVAKSMGEIDGGLGEKTEDWVEL